MEASLTTRAPSDDTLQRAVWLAASVGAFKPNELLRKVVEDASQRRALAAQLGPLCAEVLVSGTILWNLRSNARRRALAEMNEAGALQTARLPDFLQQLEPRPEDSFGLHLREALTGNVDASSGTDADFDSHYAAYEFVGGSAIGVNPGGAREAAGVLEQQVLRSAADEALKQTIGPNFVGRISEQAALTEFARTGMVQDTDITARARPEQGKVPMLFINGIGGAGKSALLAKVAKALREEGSGVRATIILDFDVPTLLNVNPIELTNEFLRQFAMCVPTLSKDLLELRLTAFADFSFSEVASENEISKYRMFERAMYSINTRLRGHLATDQRPVLVILDTFEEVLTRGPGFVWRVYRWLQDLHVEAGLPGLHVILSGRATPEDVVPDSSTPGLDPRELRPNLVGAMTLGDLARVEALELLALGGIDASLANGLMDIFGANPLVLRMLVDYAAQDMNSLRRLAHDEDSRQKYQAQAAQRLLYSRILGRIREDPALRVLASPGLLVRMVTPGVIENVLAPPCGLVPMSSERAGDLFDKLARQVWLVTRTGKFSLAHRRDVRNIMLPLVQEPGGGRSREELAAIAEDIHRRAVQYHRQEQPDPALSADKRREEAFYHELFVDPDAALGNPDIRFVLNDLEGDFGDFPTQTRARLRLKQGKALKADEIDALGKAEGSKYRAQQVAQEISNTGGTAPPQAEEQRLAEIARPFREGLGYAIPAPERATFKKKAKAPSVARKLEVGDSTSVIAAYSRAEFEAIAEAAPAIIMDFIDRASRKSGARLERDMTDHVSWIAAMSTLAIPRKSRSDPYVAVADELSELLRERRRFLAAQMLPDHSNFSLAHYAATLGTWLRLGKPFERASTELTSYAGRSEFPVSLTSNASLRIFQAAVVSDVTAQLRLQVSFVVADSLQYFAHLVDPRAIGQRASIITAQAAWSRQNPTLDVIHRAVDKLAPIAHHTLRSPALSAIERSLLSTKLDLYDWVHPRRQAAKKAPSRQQTLPWAALRGMSPDLQAPILAAVRERLQENSGRRELLDRLNNCSGVWPVDFSSKEIGDRKLGDTSLASIAHLADRFALLPMLFDGAKPESTSAKVARVYAALQRLIGSATLASGQRVALEKRVAAQARAKTKSKKKVKAKVSAKKPAKKK